MDFADRDAQLERGEYLLEDTCTDSIQETVIL